MLRKLALTLAASAAFASPAFAARRGLPETPRCTHCLPSVVTGGVAVVAKGRAVLPASPEAPVATGAAQPTTRGLEPSVREAQGRAVVNAECGCAKGSCPTHA